jgi:hypothetical protein
MRTKFRRWAVQLNQVQSVGREMAQAVFNPRRKVLATVSCNRLLRETTASLGGNDDFLRAGFLKLGDQPLAAAIAIDVRCVNEIDSRVDSFVKCGERFFVRNLAPEAANGPCSKTDFGNVPTGAAERALIRDRVLS